MSLSWNGNYQGLLLLSWFNFDRRNTCLFAIINGCSFYGCQTWDLYEKYVNQLNVEWNKAVRRTLNLPYKTHRRLLPLIVNGKSFKSQHCSRLHKYVNRFFSSENIYVSFIGAKAKTRVTVSFGGTVNPKTFLPTLRRQPLRLCRQCSRVKVNCSFLLPLQLLGPLSSSDICSYF